MLSEPFRIAIPDSAINDLHHRLRTARWPATTPSDPWQQGVDTNWLRELVDYWITTFDWRAAERGLNAQQQFMADVDGQRVHFVHRKGMGPNAYPLVITHGWPGSFFEFHALADLLCDPAAHGGNADDSFDIVVPSLPGFSFSEAPKKSGMASAQVADLWVSLMNGLGYTRFGAQGGDLGAGVSVALALRHPERVEGIHLNFLPGSYEPSIQANDAPRTPDEQRFLDARNEWAAMEGGYSHLHATKPVTAACALNDSPVGLAAWITEKFRAWSDCDGVVERRFSKDELLTNLSLYWFTESIGTSMQMYFENRLQPLRLSDGQRIAPPVAFAHFPKEINHPPRSWLERGMDVAQWTDMPRGGHFAALEEPELLAADIRRFFKRFRSQSQSE